MPLAKRRKLRVVVPEGGRSRGLGAGRGPVQGVVNHGDYDAGLRTSHIGESTSHKGERTGERECVCLRVRVFLLFGDLDVFVGD